VWHSNGKTSRILNLVGETNEKNRGGDIMGLKDYLEGLEIGEEKLKLSKEDIKGILAESGKIVTTETDKVKDEYKKTIDDLKKQVENAPSSTEIENLKNTIADMEAKEEQRKAEEKAKKEDEALTNNIISAFGDKQFINEYTKNAIISDIKKGLKDESNSGKSAKDLFEEITKDKSDIFANPNKVPDMAGMGDSETDTNKKDMPIIW
jgi:hypothetical protein